MAGVRAEKSCFRLSRHSAVRLTAEAVGELARGLWAGGANMSIARLTRSLTALFLFHAV